MKTIWGLLLNSISFFGIWILAAFISYAIAFRGWGDSIIGEYLRVGTTWFICPGIGGYFAPKVTTYFISELNVDSVIASFITTISITFTILIGFSIFFYDSSLGSSVYEMLQFTLQFLSVIVGTLMGKMAVKESS